MSAWTFRAAVFCDQCFAEGHDGDATLELAGSTMAEALERLRASVIQFEWRIRSEQAPSFAGTVDCGLHTGGPKQPDPEGTAALLELLSP